MVMCRVSHQLISMNRSICDVIAKSIFKVELYLIHGQLYRQPSNLHLSLFSKRPLHRESEKVHVQTMCARRSPTPYKLSKCTLCTGVLTEKSTMVTLK